jgi:hypothetical protein
MPDTGKTTWRRLYVFVAVALAVFLATMSGVGLVCHGFATAPVNGQQISAAHRSSTQPLSVPPELKTALAAAQQQGKQAYQAVQTAVDQYQATDVEIQDLLNAHFDDLLHSVEMAAAQNTVPSTEAQPTVPQSDTASDSPPGLVPELTVPPSSQSIINPRWQDLEDQIVQLRARRTVLSDTLLPTHPTIQKLDLSLDDLEGKIRDIPKEIPGPVSVNSPLLPPRPIVVQSAPTVPIAAPQSTILATLLPRWQKTADDYRELTNRLQTEKSQCYEALNHESAAWQRKAEIPADYIASLTTRKIPVQYRGADPTLAIYWCGLLALMIAALVARAALVSESVFQTAAQVRQRLALTILAFLPRRSDYKSRENPLREPHWIRRTLLAAELYLAALVLLLTVLSLVDHQFFGHLLANPLAACSQKFWS